MQSSLSTPPPGDNLGQIDRDADFRRRWPPDQYPALHLSAADYRTLRQRERLRRRLLNVIGDDITDIAMAVLEERKQR